MTNYLSTKIQFKLQNTINELLILKCKNKNKSKNTNNLTLHCMCFNGKYSAFIINNLNTKTNYVNLLNAKRKTFNKIQSNKIIYRIK